MSAAVGRVLAALGDDTRRVIVGRLAAGAMPTATELAHDLPITRQAVAKHLRVLEDAGVVAIRRQGREARYELRAEPLRDATAWLDDLGAQWDRRLSALKRQSEHDAR